MTEDYAPYSLKENPFPQLAIVNPKNPDIRVNGEIFRENILQDEITSIRDRMEKRTSIIYVTGLKFDKGIGKSALVVHESRRVADVPETTSVLVRCNSKNKPADLALAVAAEWHEHRYLWNAMHRILLTFSNSRQDARVTTEAIDTMFNAYQSPPESLPLTLYTHVTAPTRFAKMVAEWLKSQSSQLNEDFLEQFLTLYLSRPKEFSQKIAKIRVKGLDAIDVYANLLGFLHQSGFKNNYVFLDQLEDAIMPLPAGKIGEFCLDFRRMLEAGMEKSVMIVTLHPDSEMKLDTQAAQHLLKVAPLDAAHRIDVLALEFSGNDAIDLAIEYMNHFRTEKPDFPTFPMDPDVIRYVCFLKEGNIRQILQQLNECLKFAASNGGHRVSMDYVLEHHKETMGMLKNPTLYDEFCAKVLKR